MTSAVAMGLVGCGSHATTSLSHTASRSSTASAAPAVPRPPATAPRLAYHPIGALPAPLRDPAFAVLGGGHFVLIGGLDSADVSSSGIDVIGPTGAIHTATLPLAQHDAQGAALDGQVYVFGGGSATELDHIISFDPAHDLVRQVGTLPHAQSDVAVTSADGTAYIVGGYDGMTWFNTILAWRPGAQVRVVGHLPTGLRYAAASAVGGRVIIIGGSSPDGASNAIYRFDPRTGRVRRIGRLPHPVTHAAAGQLDGFVYLVGGRGDGLTSQTSEVLSIDPRSGTVRPAGRLPEPLSDPAVVRIGHGLLVAGGLTPTATVAQVGRLTAVSGH